MPRTAPRHISSAIDPIQWGIEVGVWRERGRQGCEVMEYGVMECGRWIEMGGVGNPFIMLGWKLFAGQ